MNKQSALHRENIINIALFVLFVFGTGALSIFRPPINHKALLAQEKRHYANCPTLSFRVEALLAFPVKFESFFNDRFVFRTPMIGFLSKAKYELFGISGTPKVLAGQDGWLFYTDNGDKETLRHVPLFTKGEVQDWVSHFEARRFWLARRHIGYLVFFAPSKCEIYPEAVPKQYAALNAQCRQDQLLEALKHSSNVQFLDLKPTLLSAKRQYNCPLYYKTDTHWNTLGAFLAYNRVAEYLSHRFPTIRPASLSEMNLSFSRYHNGDLACFMGAGDQMSEHAIVANNKQPHRWIVSKHPPLNECVDPQKHLLPFATELPDKHLPTALFIRDSFMDFPQELFSDHFKRACYYSTTGFPIRSIEREKPDIVIEEIVERGLSLQITPNPPEVDRLIQGDRLAKAPSGLLN